jgi:hypothetical protein
MLLMLFRKHSYYEGNQTEENEMCSNVARRAMSNTHETVVEILKERANLLDRVIDGSLLNCILSR